MTLRDMLKLLPVFLLFHVIFAAEHSPKTSSGHFITIATLTQGAIVMKAYSESYFKGDKARIITKMELAEGESRVMQIWLGNQVYNYVLGEYMGQKMVSPKNFIESNTWHPNTFDSVKQLGTEKIAGYDCDVYSTMGGNTEIVSWVLKNPNLRYVLKKETNSRTMSTVIETQFAEFGIYVPDSIFLLPDSVIFKEIPWKGPK